MKINEDKNCKTDLDHSLENWSKYAKVYDPIKCASIDGTDTEPHDRAVIRALNSTYKPNRFVKGRPECTIFVSRLSHETSKETIKDIFSKYGKLKRFRMVKDIVTGLPKGYAFVEFEEEHAAEEAYRIANKTVVDGNIIFVDFECERLLKGWRPRRLGGGFAGKKESGQLRFGGRDRPFKKPIALELKEKEEKKSKEKKKRREDEQKHRPDKSREKPKRRSPGFENGRNSPLQDRIRQKSPLLRDKTKRYLSAGEKEKNRSPPRKVARLNSPLKELSRHQSPPRENGTQLSPQKDHGKTRSSPRENKRPNSPKEIVKHSISRKSIQENIKRYSSPTEKAKHTSPSPKIERHRSPVREDGDRRSSENIKYVSPPRKNVRIYFNRQANVDRYSPPRGENIKQKHHSPVRDQNIEHHSPLQKHFRANVREHDRRRSPLHRNDQAYHSSTRGKEYFFLREDEGYRSPVRVDTSPRRNERHFSPSRENGRRYFPPRENVRYRSPGRENIVRRSVSPKMGANRRNSPVRESTKQYSPPREYQQFSSSRDIRHHSPPRENIRSFLVQRENGNYPHYYSEPQDSRHFSPVRENNRPFSPPRDVRQPPHIRGVDFPPPRDNARYFSPPHSDERQYFHTRENANNYSSTEDSGNYDNFPQDQNVTFSPAGATQFSELRNRDWYSNPSNRGRRFPRQRGNYRGGFRRY